MIALINMRVLDASIPCCPAAWIQKEEIEGSVSAWYATHVPET